MTTGKHTRRRMVLVSGACMALVGFVLLALLGRGMSTVALADEIAADAGHSFSYTQKQLVELMEQAVSGKRKVTPAAFTTPATFPWAEGEWGMVETIADMPQTQFLGQELEDDWLLAVTVGDDGCLVFLTMGRDEGSDQLRLKVAAVNPDGQDHAVAFSMEAVRAMPAEMKAYAWGQADDDGEDGQDSSDSSMAPASSLAPQDSSIPDSPDSGEDPGDESSSVSSDVPSTSVDPSSTPEAESSSSSSSASGSGGSAVDADAVLPDPSSVSTSPPTSKILVESVPTSEGNAVASSQVETSVPAELPASSSQVEPQLPEEPLASSSQVEPQLPEEPPEDPAPQMQERASHSVADCLGSAQVLLPANGLGVITIQTGQLYGGRLDAPANPQARAPLVSVSLQQVGLGAEQGTTDDMHGILRLYDDVATYSATDYGANYDYDANTVIYINPSPSAYKGGSFVIQLYNNNPITIQKIDASLSNFGNSSADATIQIVGTDSAREINIVNGAGDAIHTNINVTIGGTIGVMGARLTTRIEGSGYGIRAADIFFENGANTVIGGQGAATGASLRARENSATTLRLSTSGVAENVVTVSGELMSSGSTLTILGGGSKGDTVSAENVTCNTGGVLQVDGESSPGVVVNATNSVFSDGDGSSIRVTGANSSNYALYAENEVLAERGGTIHASGNNSTPAAIYCGGVTGVDRLNSSDGALVQADGALTAISTRTLLARGGSAGYGTSLSAGDTTKNRVVARGANLGVEVRGSSGGLDVSGGAVVIAHGGQTGMRAASGTPSGVADRAGAAIIATCDAGGNAFAAASGAGSVTIADGLRLVADGGAHGVSLGGTTLQVNRKGEVIAKGGTDGVFGTGQLIVSGGFVYAHGLENGIQMDGGVNVSATGGLYAVGGVAFDQLMPATDADLGKFGGDFDKLPLPPLADKVVEGPANAAGIRAQAEVKFDGEQTMGQVFGSGYGAIVSAQGLTATNGAELLAHGGDYGIYSQARVSSIGNAVLHGYGARYGIYTSTFVAVTDGYAYGYGLTNGIRVLNAAGTSFSSSTGVVGRTKIQRAGASGDMAQPAIVVGDGGAGSLVIPAGAVVHEVYDIDDLLISTPPLYELNRDIVAVGLNMGGDAQNMAGFTWLTPSVPPIPQADKRHYMNYAPLSDTGAVVLVQESTTTGLRAVRNEDDLTLVANVASGAGTACAGGAVSGAGGYRVTFNGGVQARNIGNEFKFRKVDAQDITQGITGATFALYQCTNASPGHTHAELVTDAVVAGGACWQPVPGGQQSTAADGTVDFGALPDGVYMLVETVTPDGYQQPTGQWQLAVESGLLTKITAKGDMLPPAFGNDGADLILPNMKGFAMPAAGGFGTYPFIIVGCGLIAAAFIVVLLKKMTDRRRKGEGYS